MKLNRFAVKKFVAHSVSDGTIHVIPDYLASPLEPDAAPVGVVTRLAIAKEIERILNHELKVKRP